MCIQYAKGKCKDGDFCRYAHGIDEKRENVGKKNIHKNDEEIHMNAEMMIFDEDKMITPQINDSSKKYNDNDINNNLRKIVYSSDYDNEGEDQLKSPTYDPTQHRYNYFNPFYFYSFNNFPVYNPMAMNQTMPFFNYVSINNGHVHNNFNKSTFENSENSSQFNSKFNENDNKTKSINPIVNNLCNANLKEKEHQRRSHTDNY